MKTDKEMIYESLLNTTKETFPDYDESVQLILAGDMLFNLIPVFEVVKIKNLKSNDCMSEQDN